MFFSVISSVIVAVEVSGHAGIFGEQCCDRLGIPKVVDIRGVHGEMAEEHDAFLCFGGGF